MHISFLTIKEKDSLADTSKISELEQGVTSRSVFIFDN